VGLLTIGQCVKLQVSGPTCVKLQVSGPTLAVLGFSEEKSFAERVAP